MDLEKQVKELERYIRELKQELSEVINERDALRMKNHQLTKYSKPYDSNFWHSDSTDNNSTIEGFKGSTNMEYEAYYKPKGEENGY